MFPELSTIKLISTGQRRAAQLESFAEEIGMPVQIIHLGEITYPLLSPEFHELSQHISDYIQLQRLRFMKR